MAENLSGQQQKAAQDALKGTGELGKAIRNNKKLMAEFVSAAEAYNNEITDTVELYEEAAEALKRTLKIQGGLADLDGKRLRATKQMEKLASKNLDLQRDLSALYDEEAQVFDNLLLKQTMRETGLQGEYAQMLATAKLAQANGEMTEKEVEELQELLKKRQAVYQAAEHQLELDEAIADSIASIKEESEELKHSFTKINETAKEIARNPAVLGAFMMTQGIEKLEQAHESFEHFKEQGLSAGQAIEAQFKGMSMSSMLGLSDTKGVMDGVIEQYGNVNALSGDTVDNLGKMAVHFGISGQEAAKLNASLSQMSGETSETAANAMEHVGHMAELEGIAPGKIMGDMAKNTEAMALYAKGGAKGFGEAAINLHKMGVEIGTASKMADSLLDFESSINKQMEASVLLGRSINLDKARELALNGDIEGSTKEVLANLGGSAELEKMTVVQKRALAEATGMTVEEMMKAVDAQEEQNKYFGEGASSMSKLLGYTMEYGGKAAGFFKENGLLLLTLIQTLKGTALAQKLLNGAEAAWNGIKRIGLALWNSSIMLTIRDRAVKIAEYVATGVSTLAQGAWNLTKKAGNAIMNSSIVAWIRERAATVAGYVATGVSTVAQGAWNITKGVGNALMATSLGMWIAEKAQLIANTAARWMNVGATTAQTGVNTTLAATQTTLATTGAAAGGGMASAGAGLATFAAAATPAIPVILALGLALLMASPALFALAEIIKVVAQVIGQVLMKAIEMLPAIITAVADGFVKVFTVMAENWKILIPVGVGLVAVGAGMLALGTASLFAAPGLLLGAVGLAAMLVPLTIMGALSNAGLFDKIPLAFKAMSETAPQMALLGAGLLMVGTGLAAMAVAGIAAVPIIGLLIALAAVAPALTSLGSMFGMGGDEEKGKDDQMQILIDEVRGLRAEMAKGGEVKMDGKKVGEVLRLSMNTSGIR